MTSWPASANISGCALLKVAPWLRYFLLLLQTRRKIVPKSGASGMGGLLIDTDSAVVGPKNKANRRGSLRFARRFAGRVREKRKNHTPRCLGLSKVNWQTESNSKGPLAYLMAALKRTLVPEPRLVDHLFA